MDTWTTHGCTPTRKERKKEGWRGSRQGRGGQCWTVRLQSTDSDRNRMGGIEGIRARENLGKVRLESSDVSIHTPLHTRLRRLLSPVEERTRDVPSASGTLEGSLPNVVIGNLEKTTWRPDCMSMSTKSGRCYTRMGKVRSAKERGSGGVGHLTWCATLGGHRTICPQCDRTAAP